MKLYCALLCLCLPCLCMAQERDLKDTIPARSYQVIPQNSLAAPGYRLKINSFIPVAFIGYGLFSLTGDHAIRRLDYTTRNELQEDYPSFALHADDYMQFAPAAAVYGLNLAGIKGKHSMMDATGIYVLSAAIMGGTVSALKNASHRLRPNGSGYNSFPSGHTANAFAAAEFFKQEYKEVSPWYGVAGYAVATATGALRMYNNRHWLSDVVAGAGFGILSTKLSYFVYPKLKRLVSGNDNMQYTIVPAYQQGGFGLSFNGTF